MDSVLYEEVKHFFADNSVQVELFLAVMDTIKAIGSAKIQVIKSQISFAGRYKFAWVWLPPAWAKNRPENCIALTFGVDHHIEHEFIAKAVNPYPHRWTHHLIIEKESDLDCLVIEWLTESYAFSNR
ncbi:MAG: DUF5655 domain-containing protein [Syntrophomonas sp.]